MKRMKRFLVTLFTLSVLAAAMSATAFATEMGIPVLGSEGVPDPIITGTGWSYDSTYNSFYINSGYTVTEAHADFFAGLNDDVVIYNYGTITACTFDQKISSTGVITGGTFNGDCDSGSDITGGTFNGNLNNYYGVISAGTFNGPVSNYDTITGGTFNATVTNRTSATISDGIFNAGVTNHGHLSGGTYKINVTNWNSATISGGTYSCYIDVFGGCSITGGTFTSASQVVVKTDGEISGGNHAGSVSNGGTISGGIFSGSVTNKYYGTISGGTFAGTLSNIGTISSPTGATVCQFVEDLDQITDITITEAGTAQEVTYGWTGASYTLSSTEKISSVTVNGTVLTANPDGTYTITIPANYTESTLTVSVVGSVTPINYIPGNTSIEIQFAPDATGTVTLTVNSSTPFSRDIESGSIILSYSGLPAGDNTLTLDYPGDSKYNPRTSSTTFSVNPAAPVISSPDGDKEISVYEADAAVLEVTVTGADSYEWYVDIGDGNGFTAIPGATEASYTIPSAAMSDTGCKYYCIASNIWDETVSPTFTLNVLDKAVHPNTGDSGNTMLWASLLLTSAAGILFLGLSRKKHI